MADALTMSGDPGAPGQITGGTGGGVVTATAPPNPAALANLKINPNDLTWVQGPSGPPIRVNTAVAPYVQGFLGDLAQHYPIASLVGADDHNFYVAGTHTESAHKVGLAFDVNPHQNEGANTEFDPNVVAPLAQKWGLVWGRNFRQPDSMHFTYSSASGGPVPWSPTGAPAAPHLLAASTAAGPAPALPASTSTLDSIFGVNRPTTGQPTPTSTPAAANAAPPAMPSQADLDAAFNPSAPGGNAPGVDMSPGAVAAREHAQQVYAAQGAHPGMRTFANSALFGTAPLI